MLKKTHECFAVSIEDKVAHIVLNRPQAMNAMNKAFWNDLPAIVNEIDATAAARVIVISSAGKHFSAGMDLSVFGEDGAVTNGKVDRYVAAEAFRSNIKQIQSSFNALEEARARTEAAETEAGTLRRRKTRIEKIARAEIDKLAAALETARGKLRASVPRARMAEEIARAETAHAAGIARLTRKVEGSRTRARAAEDRARAQSEALDRTRADLAAARAEIAALRGSTSWKLTRPIRGLRRVLPGRRPAPPPDKSG